MKLHEYFKYFLENTVNLNDTRIDALDSRVETTTNFLQASSELTPTFVDVIPQGSYAQKTIIRPLAGDDFDADILLHIEEVDGWDPCEYVANLYGAFRASSTYRDMVSRKTRCVTIQYANDFHVDVVPYLERAGGKYVTNRHENAFELTDPEQFNDWLDEKNRDAVLHLVPTIRLLKYLRDYKNRFSVKSIVLTALLGDRVNSARLLGDRKYYCDLPTTLVHALEDLDEYLQARPVLPVIPDPGGTGEDFSQRWDQDGYANFRNWINHYAGKIRAAYDEPDKATSVTLWQEVFGSGFQQPPIKLAEGKATAPTTEEFIDTKYGFARVPTAYTVRVVGRLQPKAGFRTYKLPAHGNRVPRSRRLIFEVVRCDVPKPFDIYWKVRNTGPEAVRRNQERGEISPDGGGHRRTESTDFRGSHWVECYVVKGGTVVASDRQQVFIT